MTFDIFKTIYRAHIVNQSSCLVRLYKVDIRLEIKDKAPVAHIIMKLQYKILKLVK